MATRQKFKFNPRPKTVNEDVTEKEVNNVTTENIELEAKVQSNAVESEIILEDTEKGKLAELVEKLENPIPKAFDLRYISPEKIRLNEDNFYPQDDIEKLAESILNDRLINNLEAYYDLENDVFILESGERRFRAITYLIEKYKDWPNPEDEEYKNYVKHVKMFEKGYPVNVVIPEGDTDEEKEINSKIRLRIANEEQRAFDPKRRAQAIKELEELLQRKNEILKSKGLKPISINEEIADKFNISQRQVISYKKVANLIPELQEEFNKNNITLTEGETISSLSDEDQKKIYELIQAGKSKKEISELTKELNNARIEAENAQKEISKLQNELAKKEKELEAEKSSLERKIEKVKEDLTKELESNNPRQATIDKLETKLSDLEKTQLDLEREKQELEEEAEKKNNKIKLLEEEIEKLKNNKATTEPKALEEIHKNLIKEETVLKNDYNNCVKSVNNLLATFKRYEKLYDADIVEEFELTKLEDLKEQINKLAEKIKVR